MIGERHGRRQEIAIGIVIGLLIIDHVGITSRTSKSECTFLMEKRQWTFVLQTTGDLDVPSKSDESGRIAIRPARQDSHLEDDNTKISRGVAAARKAVGVLKVSHKASEVPFRLLGKR